MFSYPNSRFLFGAAKRLKFPIPSRALSSSRPETVPNSKSEGSPGSDVSRTSNPSATSSLSIETERPSKSHVGEWAERLDSIGQNARLPRSVQAVYLRPLRRKAEYGLPVCDLQLRSYSVRNVEFFADFAVRAAYYLKLPVSGPVPLPRFVERWTVPRSNFVHKKSQENFERITLRRLIQIKDGHPQVVQAWLAFLRKHAFYGVGMKANVWEHESLGVAQSMDAALPEIEKSLESDLAQFGQRADARVGSSMFDRLDRERFCENKSPLTEVRRG
ncbi:hypothetical protein ASPWEDRAFT_127112 [Aspergillus wentii DTO 134E9]|uniref:Small ribosomal subunit protein uS10m n=1 Tax=Aspergillus wentii DTO 134E9 TaxID=1073089 RepID=A0A1L9RUF9_ASPWE|nr:uncharacterized protein ASPWEDRAFT_127112 [Aspergillus wentii DTO 134E9]OJJ38560.1 hypothetical protein ASPWEDRAFT_127112 [Aspergillus wentii DTO 134E9]